MMTDAQAILSVVARWARSKGKPRPQTQEGMTALVAEFLADQPTWDEVAEGDEPAQLLWDGVSTQIVDTMHGIPDDFDELVELRHKMMIEGHGDDLARDVLMDNHRIESLGAAAPWVSKNPPSGAKAMLGGQAIIRPGQDEREVARWVGDNAEATTVSIAVGTPVIVSSTGNNGADPPGPAIPFGGFQSRPFARIRWGTRQIVNSVDIDIGTGAQFSIGASFVSLSLGMDPLIPTKATGLPPPSGTPQLLTGSLSFEPIVRTENITRTLYNDNVSDGTPVLFTVPNFASDLIVFRDAFTEALLVEFFDKGGPAAGNALYSVTIAASTNMAAPVELAGDVAFVRVTPSGAAAITKLRLLFGLEI